MIGWSGKHSRFHLELSMERNIMLIKPPLRISTQIRWRFITFPKMKFQKKHFPEIWLTQYYFSLISWRFSSIVNVFIHWIPERKWFYRLFGCFPEVAQDSSAQMFHQKWCSFYIWAVIATFIYLEEDISLHVTSLSIPPKNIGKLEVFWCFQGE